MLIYFDSCTLQRPWDDQSQQRIRVESMALLEILSRIERREIALAISEILTQEITNISFEPRRLWVEYQFQRASASVMIDDVVREKAVELTKAGVKPKDAIHLASAWHIKADVFCTTDDRLLKRGQQVMAPPPRIMDPVSFVKEYPS